MRTHAKPFGVVTLLVGVATTFACNGVLGIETATLDPVEETSAPICSYPQDDPTRSCIPAGSDPCEACLEREAPGITSSCITTPAAGQAKSCRAALVEYRLCIGDDCTDQNGDCAGCLSGSPLATELSAAVRACPECRTSSIATLCEAYCACMSEKCSSSAPADCYGTCMVLDPYKQYCRWQHCERAPSPASPHCSHAIGGEGACNEASINPDDLCDGVWNGLGCDEANPDECCSKTCRGGICTPN